MATDDELTAKRTEVGNFAVFIDHFDLGIRGYLKLRLSDDDYGQLETLISEAKRWDIEDERESRNADLMTCRFVAADDFYGLAEFQDTQLRAYYKRYTARADAILAQLSEDGRAAVMAFIADELVPSMRWSDSGVVTSVMRFNTDPLTFEAVARFHCYVVKGYSVEQAKAKVSEDMRQAHPGT